MRNIVAEVIELGEGIWIIRDDKVVDYNERWNYGFMVPLDVMRHEDLKSHTTFAITGTLLNKTYTKLRHVGSKKDAIKLAHDFDQNSIWSLNKNVWVRV